MNPLLVSLWWFSSLRRFSEYEGEVKASEVGRKMGVILDEGWSEDVKRPRFCSVNGTILMMGR